MGKKIALSGALGRMGRRIADLAATAGHEIVCAIDHTDVGKVLGDITGDRRQKARITDGYTGGADVLIDFSLPEGLGKRIGECMVHRTPLVSGTTGLPEGLQTALRSVAATVPVLWAPNMSVGVNLLFSLVREAAAKLGDAYDVEIVEMHHRRKVDAPSGTALSLLRAVCEGTGDDPAQIVRHGRSGQTGERSKREIGMHALRGGDVVGDHTVIFSTEGERIELTHKASSRDTFAAGAIRAAEWIAGRAPGYYSMNQVLGL